jgi:hypothetical protein
MALQNFRFVFWAEIFAYLSVYYKHIYINFSGPNSICFIIFYFQTLSFANFELLFPAVVMDSLYVKI